MPLGETSPDSDCVIRPWYRSRLFWLGLPGLVFLLWAWLANVREDFHLNYLALSGPGEIKGWDVGSSLGSIYHSRLKSAYGFGSRSKSKPGLHFFHEALEPDEPTIYFSRRPFGTVHNGDYREVWVAWWAIVLGYGITWSGALIGWQRRKARKSKVSS